VAYEPKADQATWDALILAKGLVIDPVHEAALFAEKRRDYQERDQRHQEAEERRQREIRERHIAAVGRVARLSDELKGDDPNTAVRVRVDSDAANIRSITVQSRYDEEGVRAIKASGGKWDPNARTWTVYVGYGELRTAERVRDAVLDMRARMDQRRR
jgi:hypothetical protein